MFAQVRSAQTDLLRARVVDIEVDLSSGLYAFSIVGLPDKAVEEARDRVSAAIKNSGFKSPKSRNQKVVISLAPADIKKEGSNFDLPIALSYLQASGDIRFNPKDRLFLGELSLDGTLRPVRGVLPIVAEAKKKGFREIFVPADNAREAALIRGITIFPATKLTDVILHINEIKGADKKTISPAPETEIELSAVETLTDMSDVKGQEGAKRGLEIAAAGGHNIAMWGPPGTGKTMLARALAGIMPALSFDEMLEVTAIHSVAGTLSESLVTTRPVRTPHHTSSHASVVGGGSIPKPGEVTLAHRGILFLDEFPEFDRRVIEALRQPLEDRVVSVSRAKGSANFPANILLVAALNPCPCGNFGVKGKECTCTPGSLERYRRKMSGPIVDRIDLWVFVGPIEHRTLGTLSAGEKSEKIRARVEVARERQMARREKHGLAHKLNSEMSAREIDTLIPLSNKVRDVLNSSASKMGLSGRAYHRILKLARTIADLSGSESVEEPHILEALQYRPKNLGAY